MLPVLERRVAARRLPADTGPDRASEPGGGPGTEMPTPPLRAELDRMCGETARLRAELDRLSIETARSRAELDRLREQVQAPGEAIDLLLGSQGRRGSRLLGEADLRELAGQLTRVCGAPDAYGRLLAAYRTLVELELRGVDRFAGGTVNVLGKLAGLVLLEPPDGEILEIGTCSGTFAAGVVRQLSRAGIAYRLTVLDPFHDPGPRPVARTVTGENLRLAGIDTERTRLISGDAADPVARSLVGQRRYGVIVLDGEHTAAAVATDLALAEQVAAPGAIVLVDDYDDENWPGVRESTDLHLAGPTRFESVAALGRGLFLRAGTVPAADTEWLGQRGAACAVPERGRGDTGAPEIIIPGARSADGVRLLPLEQTRHA